MYIISLFYTLPMYTISSSLSIMFSGLKTILTPASCPKGQ